MMRVTIEILPYGDETKARNVAQVLITNRTSALGARTGEADHYSAYSVEQAFGNVDKTQHRSTFRHFRDDGAIACVAAALRSLGK